MIKGNAIYSNDTTKTLKNKYSYTKLYHSKTSLKIPHCSQFSWPFSVQQQAAPKRKHIFPWKIKILHLYNYISIKISGVSRINHRSFWSHDIFHPSSLYLLLALSFLDMLRCGRRLLNCHSNDVMLKRMCMAQGLLTHKLKYILMHNMPNNFMIA